MAYRAEAILAFNRASLAVDGLLSERECIAHFDSVLYLGDEVFLSQLLQIKSLMMEVFESERERKYFSFDKIIKIHNPSSYAIYFKLMHKTSYKMIRDEEKVMEKLPALFDIWKNKERRTLENLFEQYEYTHEEQSRLKEALENKIKEATIRLDEVMRNFEMYEPCITTYRNRKVYPYIYFQDSNGKFVATQLYTLAPNMLYYHEEGKPLARKDATTEAYLNQAENVFGDFFVKPKEASHAK